MAELRWVTEVKTQVGHSSSATARAARKRAIPWSLASLVVGGIIAGLLTWSLKPPPPITRSVTRFPIELPSLDLTLLHRSVVDLSPDGERLVYTSSHQLYLREMDQLEARPIPGTEGGFAPFFSPDGQWVGFFVGTEVKKVSISGGASLTLCDATQTPITGAWGPNDTIVYGIAGGTGLFQVSAAGGTPQPLTELDADKGEGDHDWPQILPDGKSMLFTIRHGPGKILFMVFFINPSMILHARWWRLPDVLPHYRIVLPHSSYLPEQ